MTTPLAASPPLISTPCLIVVDPGHGGHDVGTQSVSKPRYQEKSFNLVTAKFVKNYLEQLGYQVAMTREEDRFLSLERRARFANEKKPALFVSIHFNAALNPDAQGIEVFYYPSLSDKKRATKSRCLAQLVLKQLLMRTTAKSRGVKQGNFAVIRETQMAAILVESGFLTNESELQKIKEPTYLKKIAKGITDGIDNYLRTQKNL